MVVMRHEKNLGSVRSLNDGVIGAHGKYIARIDDDDVWCDKEKLAKQIEFLEEHSDYALVGSGIIKIAPDGSKIGRYLFPEEDIDIRKTILVANPFAHSSVVYRKSMWRAAGGYEEKYGFFADRALWLKMGTLCKFYNFPEYGIWYLEKEHGGRYERRNTSIRRRVKANTELVWRYRNRYPGFRKALCIAWANYAYSFMPFRYKMYPFLLRSKRFLFGFSGHTYFHIKR